jgi:hypothetical protein
MFFIYLRRELRRRIRQAAFIALGLALGIGLVITVTAAAAGVRDAQGNVLHSLYGVGTDVTITKTPTAGSGLPGSFNFRGQVGAFKRPAAGTKIDVDTLRGPGLATLAATSVTSVAKLPDVAAAAGGLTLTDTKVTGTIPAFNTSPGGGLQGGGGGFRGTFTPTSFSVTGVDLAHGELGPLSSGKITKGRTFIGVGLGFAGAALVRAFAPALSATLNPSTGSATPGGAQAFGGAPGGGFPGGGGGPGGFFRRAAADAARTVPVHLTAPVTLAAVLVAVLLAVAGGLVAGSFGGWRAARLRPAAALARVE